MEGGSSRKVIEVALDQVAYGWDAQEIHAAHPNLSMAQIHAALSYYYDHKPAMDAQMQQQMADYDRLRDQASSQLTRPELLDRLEGK